MSDRKFKLVLPTVYTAFTAILVIGFLNRADAFDGPCQNARRERAAARELFQKCVSEWIGAENPARSVPSSECQGDLSSFIAKAKVMRECREKQKTEREEKRNDRKKHGKESVLEPTDSEVESTH